MRFALILSGILSAGVALSSIPASATVSGDLSQPAATPAYYSCPVYEGYPDCHPDDASAGTTQFGRIPALARTAAPHMRKVMPSRVATTRLRLPQ
jgi:hypothetical protein